MLNTDAGSPYRQQDWILAVYNDAARVLALRVENDNKHVDAVPVTDVAGMLAERYMLLQRSAVSETDVETVAEMGSHIAGQCNTYWRTSQVGDGWVMSYLPEWKVFVAISNDIVPMPRTSEPIAPVTTNPA